MKFLDFSLIVVLLMIAAFAFGGMIPTEYDPRTVLLLAGVGVFLCTTTLVFQLARWVRSYVRN